MEREISPVRAAVRPRVAPVGDACGEPALLEELVAERLASGARGRLHLIGSSGSGRTTALRHLAHCFGPRDDLVLDDRTSGVEEIGLAQGALLVSTGTVVLPRVETWRMAPWGDDDRIEYLLARHRAACGAVLPRCRNTPVWLDLQGHAALWTACLDELVRDPETSDVTSALVRILERALAAAPHDPKLRTAALIGLWHGGGGEHSIVSPAAFPGRSDLLRAALEIPSAALCLGAIVARRELLLATPREETWGRLWREHAIEAVAAVFPAGEGALAAVEQATLHATSAIRCKALGVLHLLDPARSARALLSAERSTEHKKWHDVDLRGIALPAAAILDSKLQGCSLRGANLGRARLDSVDATDSSFSRSRMQRSIWSTVNAPRSDFSNIHAARAMFGNCMLENSRWLCAALESSRWTRVDAPCSHFDGARLDGAALLDCRLMAAELGTVDLSRALLERCDLSACDFRAARLEGTVFRHCRLRRTEWSGAIARGVELDTCALGQAHFTDSVLTGCSLRGSSLEAAGLAGTSWVGCDLREVDFTHASFHLGSSRSGLLVGAPPSWGTRTGFYPRDDGIDSSARPEQVRKADLRECDLRDAQLDRCDFYLVDLRGALLSESQVDHLRRCKAILDREPRVE